MQTENQTSSHDQATEAPLIQTPQWTFETIPNEDGAAFLVSKLGEACGAQFDNLVFYFAGQLTEQYNGGFWELRSLPNGAFFYDLQDEEEEFNVSWTMNYFNGTMSAQAMSIAASVFALQILAEQSDDDRVTQALIGLRDFACMTHPESTKLCSLFD